MHIRTKEGEAKQAEKVRIGINNAKAFKNHMVSTLQETENGEVLKTGFRKSVSICSNR